MEMGLVEGQVHRLPILRYQVSILVIVEMGLVVFNHSIHRVVLSGFQSLL